MVEAWRSEVVSKPRFAGAHEPGRRLGRRSRAATARPKRRPKRCSVQMLGPAVASSGGGELTPAPSIPAPRQMTPEAPVGADTKPSAASSSTMARIGTGAYPGGPRLGPTASPTGVGVAGGSHAAGGGGGGGGDPGGDPGTSAAPLIIGALGPATIRGSSPVCSWPWARGAPQWARPVARRPCPGAW